MLFCCYESVSKTLFLFFINPINYMFEWYAFENPSNLVLAVSLWSWCRSHLVQVIDVLTCSLWRFKSDWIWCVCSRHVLQQHITLFTWTSQLHLRNMIVLFQWTHSANRLICRLCFVNAFAAHFPHVFSYNHKCSLSSGARAHCDMLTYYFTWFICMTSFWLESV